MSKPETRDEIKTRKAITAWQPRLPQLAAAAKVRPGFVQLAIVTIEGGLQELQVCVAGRNDAELGHNQKAVKRAMATIAAAAGVPAIPVKRHSRSCESHVTVAPV